MRRLLFVSIAAGTLFAFACGLEITGTGMQPHVDPPDVIERGDGAQALIDAQVQRGPCGETATPSMVDAGSYCIDSTEVTQLDYQTFLDTIAGTDASLPASCSWKANFAPGIDGGPCPFDPAPGIGTLKDYPVSCVDWCDAYAYCHWAGKRLCGAIDGGAVPYAQYRDSGVDQWTRACSANDVNVYAYGPAPLAGMCNSSEQGRDASVATAALQKCVGGVPGLHDMIGNVWEMEDQCVDDDAGAYCVIRGGSYLDNASVSSCLLASVLQRNARQRNLGFRCCSAE